MVYMTHDFMLPDNGSMVLVHRSLHNYAYSSRTHTFILQMI